MVISGKLLFKINGLFTGKPPPPIGGDIQIPQTILLTRSHPVRFECGNCWACMGCLKAVT